MTTTQKKFDITLKAALFISVLTAVFIICAIPINSHDFWWHLNTGDFILEHTQLPGGDDPYTYSILDSDEHNQIRAEIINKQYWLSQVFLSLANSLMGLQGVIFLRVLVYAALILAVFQAARKRSTFIGASLLLPILILTLSIVLEDTDRPQNFGFLYALLTLLTVEMTVLKKRASLLYLTLPIILVYSNSHAGAVVSICYLATYTFFSFFEQRLLPLRKHLVICLGLALLVIAFNPTGYQIFSQLLFPQQSFAVTVTSEYRSPLSIFRQSLQYPGWASYWLFALIAPITIGFLLLKKHFSACFILAATLAMSLLSIRYILFFAPLAYFFTSAPLDNLLEKTIGNFRNKRTAIEISIVLSFAVYLLLLHPNMQYFSFHQGRLSIGPELRQDIFPINAARFLKENSPAGNIFNLEAWGGYLEYQLSPEYKFFTDTRNLDENRLRQHFAILSYNSEGIRLIEHYGINTIVIPPIDYISGSIFNIVRALYRSPDWQLIYFGKNALIFSRDKRFNPIDKSMIYVHTYYQLNYWSQIYSLTPTFQKSLQEAQYYLGKR